MREQRVSKVIALMEENLRRALTLEETAQVARLSPAYFCRVFKSTTTMTPTQYLRMLRIKKAQELLTVTLLSVKEIMLKVGIQDQSHFTRDFKAVTGLTPTQYRARQQSYSLAPKADEPLEEMKSKLAK